MIDTKNLQSSRFSIAYWQQEENKKIPESYDLDLYPSMFIEDLYSGIMPWKEIATQQIDARLNPQSSEVERLVIQALPSQWRIGQSLYDTIKNFVTESTHVIASTGEVYYEIVYLRETKTNAIVAFRLHLLPIGIIKKKRKVYRQYIPREVAKEYGLTKNYVDIPKDLIIHIRIPKEIVDIKKYKRILNHLKELSTTSLPPNFAINEILQTSTKNMYSSDYFHRVNDLILARITKEIGWFARSLLDKRAMQFYSVLRFLRFHKFKAKLRQTIISAINDALTQAGKELGFSAEIEISGVLTVDDIEELIDALMHGKMEFSDIYKHILSRG